MARIFGGISIIIAILGVAGFFRVSEPAFPPVNAQSRDSGRLQLQYTHTDSHTNTRVSILCDSANGNLVYISDGSYSGSIELSENKCAKDPRFSQNR